MYTRAHLQENGDLVIEQHDGFEEERQVVVIAQQNVMDFIDKLTDLVGIPSFP